LRFEEEFMLTNTLAAVLFVTVASGVALGCSSADKDVHVPASDQSSGLGRAEPGATCTVPEGGDGTDTTQCPYYACYCKGGNEGTLCTDFCNAGVCQGATATCAFECKDYGGVDHIGPATDAICG
jgi:hypothetical protein